MRKRLSEQSGGWRRNGRKAKPMKQRDLPGAKPAFIVPRRDAKNGRAGVRAFIVALKPSNVGRAKGRRKMETLGTMRYEEPPSPVPTTATQDGEVRLRWSWTERAVGTERMLTALEQGVKGGCWPNSFFAEQGLLSLLTAHDSVVQSSRR